MTYRKKIQYMFLGSLLFLMLVYFYAIKKTFQIKNEVNELKNIGLQGEAASSQIAYYENQLAVYDSSIGYLINNSEDYPHQLLAAIADICEKNNLTLTNFPKPELVKENDYEVLTYRISVQGEFNPVNELAYQLERKLKMGKISSLKFEAKKNNQIKKSELYCTIILQNIRNKL